MEDKKKTLSTEELEQVTGGVYKHTNPNGVPEWKCSYCNKSFSTLEEAKAHEANYHYEKNGGYGGSLKPITIER